MEKVKININLRILVKLLCFITLLFCGWWGWCGQISQDISAEDFDVQVITHKKKYLQGETMVFTVTNNSDEEVYIYCSNTGYLNFRGLERLEEDKWINIWEQTKYKTTCTWGFDSTRVANTFRKIDPGKSTTIRWNQKMWTHCDSKVELSPEIGESKFTFVPSGEYRLKFTVYLRPYQKMTISNMHTPYKKRITTSNEFVIK